jgi:glycosyltransferase involved in cell wall biosynthesis
MIEPTSGHVTVVVPTRNRRALLAETLATVLGQKDVDIRVVVVDEASSDGTSDWLRDLGDPRVVVVRHDRPCGAAAARNAGVAHAETAWVAFCDDDDLWAPDKISRQLNAVEAEPGARWVVGGSVSVDDALQVTGHHRPPPAGDILTSMEAHNVVPAGASNVVVATELFREIAGFDTSFTHCEDFDCWIRLAQRSPVATVDRPLVAYRVAGHNRSYAVREMRAMHDDAIRRHRRSITAEEAKAGDLVYAQYLARFPLRQGRRFAAALAYLDVAWRFRLPSHVAHAGLALVAPGSTEHRRATAERELVPEEWRAIADEWLEPIRRSGLARVPS